MAGWAFDDPFDWLVGWVPFGVTLPPRVGFFAMGDPPLEDRAAGAASASSERGAAARVGT
jgi:hypothetical protein